MHHTSKQHLAKDTYVVYPSVNMDHGRSLLEYTYMGLLTSSTLVGNGYMVTTYGSHLSYLLHVMNTTYALLLMLLLST